LIEDDAATARTLALRTPVDRANQRFWKCVPHLGKAIAKTFADRIAAFAHDRGYQAAIQAEQIRLAEQFYPAFRRSKRILPKSRRGKPFFFESFRQGGNCNPRSLTSFFYFRGPQASACHLIDQIRNHYCSGLVSRQTGLAQHL
jgi:hypothetical protein